MDSQLLRGIVHVDTHSRLHRTYRLALHIPDVRCRRPHALAGAYTGYRQSRPLPQTFSRQSRYGRTYRRSASDFDVRGLGRSVILGPLRFSALPTLLFALPARWARSLWSFDGISRQKTIWRSALAIGIVAKRLIDEPFAFTHERAQFG